MATTGTYDYGIVALSDILAVFVSCAALDLAGRVTAAHRTPGTRRIHIKIPLPPSYRKVRAPVD